MKKVLLLCLLAFSITAKAQCPIDEILTTKEPLAIAALIENNTECIKQALTSNLEYQNFKVYVDYLYNSSSPWVYHTNQLKEKLFDEFYETWGETYPNMSANLPVNEEFYKAIKEMVATDPEFFAQKKETKIPVVYQQWLYIKSLNAKYGVRNIMALANATAKIANLPVTNYSVYVSN